MDSHPGRQFSGIVRQVRKAPQVVQNVVTYFVVLSAASGEPAFAGHDGAGAHYCHRTGPVLKVPLAALRYAPKPKEGAAAGEQANSGKGFNLLGRAIYSFPAAEPPRCGGSVSTANRGLSSSGLVEDDSSHAAVLSSPLSAGDGVIVGEAATAAPRRLFGIRSDF